MGIIDHEIRSIGKRGGEIVEETPQYLSFFLFRPGPTMADSNASSEFSGAVHAALDVHPRPPVTEELAQDIATRLWGVPVDSKVTELGSHQDRNYRVKLPDGTSSILRIANRSWFRGALEAQDAAQLLLAERGNVLAPKPLPSVNGKFIEDVDVGGTSYMMRMLTFVEGEQLSQESYLAPCAVEDLGRLAATCVKELEGFSHPGLDRQHPGQWDLRGAKAVVGALLPSISDETKRVEVTTALESAWTRVEKLAPNLRIQAIHSDITEDNVVAEVDEAGRRRPNGIIDFGDLTRSWTVAELVITCSCVLRHPPYDPMAILPAIKAFHQQVPLTEDEVAAFWPLLILRGATLVASGQHQVLLDPDNPSVTEPLAGEWKIFKDAWDVPMDVAEAAIKTALGLPLPRALEQSTEALRNIPTRLIPSLVDSKLAVVDFSTTSAQLNGGKFLEGSAAELAVLKQAAGTSGAAAARWSEPRLTRTKVNCAEVPETVVLGVELLLPAGSAIVAPLDGKVRTFGDSLVLDTTAAGLLLLTGLGVASTIQDGSSVTVGTPLGTTKADTSLYVQLCLDRSIAVGRIPSFVAPGPLSKGWLAVCPDPSPLLVGSAGTLVAPGDDSAALLSRRDKVFAKVQEHYYEDPMQMERGWKQHLIDTSARSYVDMVNNVAAIGHSHPVLADAVHQQLQLLNTNSRFHYAAVAELSEKLVAVAPKGLDTVLLVNSGSEAVDLALRMAQVVTHRMDILSVLEAYHGWTLLSDAVTTSLYDNPRALETRPDWIHLTSAPNSFRGKFRGPDAGKEYAQEFREIVDGMVAKGRPPAAFICEPLFGNAGGIVLPEGYLASAYEAVRAAGGYVIADEVQVGYGRTGDHFWAHEAHGVVPDMITIAKAMGNGFPLGAVICRKEIAQAFQDLSARFFSSAGGSPASCVAGLSVLKVLKEEELQENARLVGNRIIEKCQALAEKYPIIGAVHGRGLYLGVELAKDRTTLEPATSECYAICDRLRELGCIVQPTGERANVLKVKPPMCLSAESADFFMEQLETVLREGW